MIGQTSSASRAAEASGRTGTVCSKSGPYQCISHVEIVMIFKSGDRFTNCPVNDAPSKNEGHATTWSMVRTG
jgi:hypothetical protein